MLRIGGQEIPTRTVILVAFEGFLVLAGLLSALAIRSLISGTDWTEITSGELAKLGFAALICELTLYYSDLYDTQVTRTRISVFVRLLQAFGFTSLILALLYSLIPELAVRGVAAIAAPLILILILTWRLILHATGLMWRRSERVVVLGTGPVGIAAVREICARPELNLNVVGFLDKDPANVGKPLVNPGIVACTSDLEQFVAREKISRVMISLQEKRDHMPISTLLRLMFAGVTIEDAGAVLERITGRICVEQSSDLTWLILSGGFRKSAFVMFAKRLIDMIVAMTLLVVFTPVMAVVALAIVIESGHPVLFRQKRVGAGGRVFEMLKFRSMRQDAEASGPQWASDGDARVTRIGRIIRTYRLDELPQLWNVLCAKMSLVGPRPEQPYFCELLEKKIPLFAQRYTVRPGITGWAQIKYGYGASIDDSARKLEFDLFYLKHLSLKLDLVIILETMKVVLLARGSK